LIVGQTGGGKSGYVNAIVAEQVQGPHDPILLGVDLKRVELGPWAPCFERLAVTPADASALLSDTVRDLDRRLEWLDRRGLRKYRHGCGLRPLTLVVDELVQAVWQQWDDEDPRAPARRRGQLMKIAALGRAAGVQVVCATQEPVAEMVGRIRVNMQTTICCRVRTLTDAEVAVGKGLAGDLHPENLTLDGAAWAVPATSRPVLVRARWLDDDEIASIAAAHRRR
jgi:S-DNA-T family DNA segregation ATPase FtsK/SpoIIIE